MRRRRERLPDWKMLLHTFGLQFSAGPSAEGLPPGKAVVLQVLLLEVLGCRCC